MSASDPVFALTKDIAEGHFDELTITDGRKAKEGVSTYYRVNLGGRGFKLQLGHGLKDESASVSMRLIRTKKDGELLLTVDCPAATLLHANIKNLEQVIGKKLFENLDGYFTGGQIIPTFLDFENFMTCCSSIIAHDDKYDQDTIYARIREKSQVYLVQPNEVTGKGWTKKHMHTDFDGNYADFRGTLSLRVSVSTSMYKGVPKWGLFISLYDAYCIPTTRAVESGKGCEFEDEDDVFVEAEPAEEDYEMPLFTPPPVLKRARSERPIFVEPQGKKPKA